VLAGEEEACAVHAQCIQQFIDELKLAWYLIDDADDE